MKVSEFDIRIWAAFQMSKKQFDRYFVNDEFDYFHYRECMMDYPANFFKQKLWDYLPQMQLPAKKVRA